MKLYTRNGIRNVRQDERGATMIEGALAIFLFLALTLILFSIVYLSFNMISAQFLAARAAREAIVDPGPAPLPSTCAARVASIKQRTIQLGQGLGFSNLQPNQIFVCPASIPRCSGNDPGRAGDFIIVRIRVPLRLFFGGQDLNIEMRAVARNESYVDCTAGGVVTL